MPCRPRALIIGGSVGGLLAFALLRKAGWESVIFERARGDLAGRGAGLGISQNLVEIMYKVGARFDMSSGSAHSSYVWMGLDEKILFEHVRPTVGSTWPRVYQPLRELAPEEHYRQGKNLVRIEQTSTKVTALFADGASETGDLLVGADGLYSTVRRQFLPDVEPVYASYVAWRGMVEETDMSEAVLKAIGHRIVFCYPAGEMLLCMTVPGSGDDVRYGHRRIYFIWYRPVSRDRLVEMFTDATGKNHGVSIPPPLIRPEFPAEVKSEAYKLLPACIAEVINRTPQILLQAVSDLQTPKMVFGRVALMGDAAFIARPHTAAGVSKAALDAQCLADELTASDGDVSRALASYEGQRMAFGQKLCAHSRYLGAFLEAKFAPPEGPHTAGLKCDPAQMIREYGAQMLLRDAEISSLQAH